LRGDIPIGQHRIAVKEAPLKASIHRFEIFPAWNQSTPIFYLHITGEKVEPSL
jgi:hypothetical protein